jgi:hypothetical protein
MKKYSLSLVGILTTVIIGLFVLVTPTFAQDAGRVDKMERLVETQQRQLVEQKQQLDALMRMV